MGDILHLHPLALGALVIVCVLLVILAITFYLTGLLFFHRVFSRRKNDRNFLAQQDPKEKTTWHYQWFFQQKNEEVRLQSADGLLLTAHLLRGGQGRLAVLVHGYHGRYYSLTLPAWIFHELGYDVLLLNSRVHDASEGHWLSMGEKEKRDIIAWLKKALSLNKDLEIVLYGASLGAHEVLRTITEDDLPINVRACIADCGFLSLREELIHEVRLSFPRLPLPGLIVRLGLLHGRLFHHLKTGKELKSVLPKARCPVMLIHGGKDQIVPVRNIKDIHASLPAEKEKLMKIFPDAGHNESVLLHPEEYKNEVALFLSRHIKSSGS